MVEEETSVPWRLRDIVWSIVAGFALVIAFGLIAFVAARAWDLSLSEPIAISLGIILTYSGFLLAAYLVVVRRRGTSFRTIGFVGVPLSTLLLMVPVYIGIALVMGVVVTVVTPLLGEPPETSQQLLGTSRVSLSPLETVMMLLAVSVVTSIVEELYFRGLIYRYLRGRLGVSWAVWLSSALFAVAHPFLAVMPVLFVFGLFLAFVTERYGSLYPAMVLHALLNAAAVLTLAAS